jgi:hypothetical protein
MKIIGFGAAALAFAGFAAPLYADEAIVIETVPAPAPDTVVVKAPLRAPRRAFELGVDMGYTQGFGALDGTRNLRQIEDAGIALGLSLGYRATPGFSIAATGQFQGFSADDRLPSGTMVRGAATGLAGTFHIAPYERVDPFITLGTGYRMLWEVPTGSAPTTLSHGFEMGKLEIGVDLRPTENIAIAPVLGADLDMFMWRNVTGTDRADISNRGVSAFLFAGVRGRFDIGGARDTKIIAPAP